MRFEYARTELHCAEWGSSGAAALQYQPIFVYFDDL